MSDPQVVSLRIEYNAHYGMAALSMQVHEDPPQIVFYLSKPEARQLYDDLIATGMCGDQGQSIKSLKEELGTLKSKWLDGKKVIARLEEKLIKAEHALVSVRAALDGEYEA